MIRAAWIAMEVVCWYVIVPLAVASAITGLAMALGTGWGLFRHYWVLFSLVLTVFATAALVLHMPSVSSKADIARGTGAAELLNLGGDLFDPGAGLVVLVVIQVRLQTAGYDRVWTPETARASSSPGVHANSIHLTGWDHHFGGVCREAWSAM